MNTIFSAFPTLTPLQQTRVEVFEQIFIVFLALGTLVGVVVVAYTLYNAYKYRDDGAREHDDNLPTVGELPTGGKGGRKLFVSFGLSAVIVVGLVIWTYTMLLYVETGPNDGNPGEDALEVDVEGQMFSWTYEYENGVETNDLVVPEDTPIWVNVTATDVWHAFGIAEERVKADAIPGEYDQTWFMTDELSENDGDEVVYEDAVECFELCGAGHSNMKGDLVIMEEEAFEEWLADEEAALEEDNDDEDDAENTNEDEETGEEDDA